MVSDLREATRTRESDAENVGTVAILGLGLMGGSLARDLSALGLRVLGYDGDPATTEAALASGCIHGVLGGTAALRPEPDGAVPEDPFRGIEEADLVVLALPVAVATDVLERLAHRLGAVLVTDVGSTKRSIVATARAAGLADRFVGSHPLAGDHRSGWPAARAGLFRGATVFLCPPRCAAAEAGGGAAAERTSAALEQVAALWRWVGGEPQPISAEEHDARMAWVSHLPQAASSALAAALAGSGYGAGAVGPGGRDVTRLAASSPALWTDILLDNADLLEPALASFGALLDGLRAAVDRRDGPEVTRILAAGRAWKEGDGESAPSGENAGR